MHKTIDFIRIASVAYKRHVERSVSSKKTARSDKKPSERSANIMAEDSSRARDHDADFQWRVSLQHENWFLRPLPRSLRRSNVLPPYTAKIDIRIRSSE